MVTPRTAQGMKPFDFGCSPMKRIQSNNELEKSPNRYFSK
jgi:hypothetical protein